VPSPDYDATIEGCSQSVSFSGLVKKYFKMCCLCK